ncbi:2'-5' RNA ligase family protein [Hyphococcus lacteus]|uniref:2'-5' RNA ligase family protein n=1 Tax=Hyphococcus lacteus TaxID=3143536 RepID=A0ABV3Z5I7_9PROT
MDAPIIISLQFDEETSAFFEAQREKHYPTAINNVPAHLTLFHNLPGAHFDEVLQIIGRTSAIQYGFPISVTEVMRLGRGVAYRVSGPPLLPLRAKLVKSFGSWLTGQDRQGFRPHVTIQNKVSIQEAMALHAHLSKEFSPRSGWATGLQIWRYQGPRGRSGHWQPAGAFGFRKIAERAKS